MGITFWKRDFDTDSGEKKIIYIFLWYRIAGASGIRAGKHQIKGYTRQDKICCAGYGTALGLDFITISLPAERGRVC